MSKSISLLTARSSEVTMTLKEITDILGVRHDNAMRTVSEMAQDMVFGHAPQIEERYNSGKNTLITYRLNKRQSIAVAAKLNVSLLMQIIDRWQELEDAAAAAAAPSTTIRLQADTKLEFLLNSVRLAYECKELAKAVSQRMAIGDYSTWTQLRNANPQNWYMQERNVAWIPAALSKKAKTDGVHIPQYGTDGANSQFQGRAYPTEWLVQSVTSLLKTRYGFNGELQAPLREEIRPVLAEQILVQAEYMQAGMLGIH